MDDISKAHEARGEVRCELCGAWCRGIPTLDDCYLCQPCHDASPKISPAQWAMLLGGWNNE